MEAIRQWLMGIAACALLVSILRRLAPKGTAGEVARFAGGLILLLAVLHPLRTVDLAAITWDRTAYDTAMTETREIYENEQKAALSAGIAERLGEYIEANAAARGLAVQAEVIVEEQTLQPQRVILSGQRSEELSRWIAQTLMIAKENQQWKEER